MLFTFSEVQDLDKCFVAGVFVVVPLRCKCKDSQFYNCLNNFGREIPPTPPDILNGVSSCFQHLQFNGTLFIVNGSEILDLIWEGGGLICKLFPLFMHLLCYKVFYFPKV